MSQSRPPMTLHWLGQRARLAHPIAAGKNSPPFCLKSLMSPLPFDIGSRASQNRGVGECQVDHLCSGAGIEWRHTAPISGPASLPRFMSPRTGRKPLIEFSCSEMEQIHSIPGSAPSMGKCGIPVWPGLGCDPIRDPQRYPRLRDDAHPNVDLSMKGLPR